MPSVYFSHDLHVGLGVENRLEPLADGLVVVRQQNAQFAAGSLSHSDHDMVKRS